MNQIDNQGDILSLKEPAWERRSEIGLLRAFFQTVLAVLLFPSRTFSRVQTSGEIISPFLFFVILSSLSLFIQLFYQMYLFFFNKNFLFIDVYTVGSNVLTTRAAVCSLILKTSVLEAFLILAIFIIAGLIHLSLKILKSAKGPFEVTFKVGCYVIGSIGVLSNIFLWSISGVLRDELVLAYYFKFLVVFGVLGTIIYFIGLKKSHHISGWRTFFSILLAIILYFVAGFSLMLIVLIVKHIAR